MKTSLVRKVMALVVALMMLVPMAAQAEALNGYGELELSNVVVNYMGTELDFSGLDVRLLGGINAEEKNALVGLAANLPDDNSAAVAIELGESEMTMLLLNQLITIPYDRFGEAMAKMDTEVPEGMEDISGIMAQAWQELAALDLSELSNSVELNMPDVDANFLEEYISSELESAVAEEAEFELAGETCKGYKVALSLSEEKASAMIADSVTAIYGNEEVKAMLAPVWQALESAMAQSGEVSVDFAAMYDVMVDGMSRITIPGGMNITVFADETGTQTLCQIDRFAMDLSDYLASIMEFAGEETEGQEEALIEMDMSIGARFVSDDADEAEYIEAFYNVYVPDTGYDGALVSIGCKALDEDDGGYLDLGMTVSGEATGADDANMSLSCAWSDVLEGESFSIEFALDDGADNQTNVSLGWADEHNDDTTDGALTLDVTSDGQTMNMLDLSYSYAEAGENAYDVSFTCSLMGMLSVSA
ncbi:MAG: hypothetical protein ACI4L8_12435, partial [Candidatus Fimadaptatus sp.]